MVVQEDLSADLVTHGVLLKVQHALYVPTRLRSAPFALIYGLPID